MPPTIMYDSILLIRFGHAWDLSDPNTIRAPIHIDSRSHPHVHKSHRRSHQSTFTMGGAGSKCCGGASLAPKDKDDKFLDDVSYEVRSSPLSPTFENRASQ